MALMDKMKAQASQLAQKAQEAGKAGQAKLEDLQSARKADALYKELGQLVYNQKRGKSTEDASKADDLMNQIDALEKEDADAAAGAAPAAAADTSTTPEGGFKL